MPPARLPARGPSVLLALVLAVPGPAPAAGPPSIEHEAPGCVAAGRYFRLAACFRPPTDLARARVYFRARGTADWFYVDMSGEPPCLEAVLPRPKKGLDAVEYYVAAADEASAEGRTTVRAVRVSDGDRCEEGPMAPVAEDVRVVIGSTSGAAPAGFLTGRRVLPLVVAGGAVLVGGTAALALTRGGKDEGEDSGPVAVLARRWRSHLDLAGGRGQVVVDGAVVPLPLQGTGTLAAPGAGPHHVEATLLAGAGRAGTWLFDLSALGLVPGSLRVIAGDSPRLGADQVVFRLSGRSGDRVAFSFALPAAR